MSEKTNLENVEAEQLEQIGNVCEALQTIVGYLHQEAEAGRWDKNEALQIAETLLPVLGHASRQMGEFLAPLEKL